MGVDGDVGRLPVGLEPLQLGDQRLVHGLERPHDVGLRQPPEAEVDEVAGGDVPAPLALLLRPALDEVVLLDGAEDYPKDILAIVLSEEGPDGREEGDQPLDENLIYLLPYDIPVRWLRCASLNVQRGRAQY